MNVLVLLGFVTFALAEKQSNQLDCSIKGPEFWCKNEATARKCNAVNYCKQYVWSKEKLVSPDADKCTTCQQFVGTIHMLLMNNATQAEVIAGMEAVCNLLPTISKSICIEVLATYGKEIVADIKQYTKDPRKLCITLRLCSSNANRVVLNNFLMMKKVLMNKVFADYCMPCKEYISGLHSITSSKKTKSDLVRAMKKMCQFLPIGVSTLCPAMVNAKGKQIVDSVIDYTSDPSRFCATVGLCKNRDSHPLIMQIPEVESKPAKKSDYIRFSSEESPDADTCKYCQQFVGTIHMMLMNNETQVEVIDGMEAACNLLPTSTKGICTALVAEYGKTIVADILEYTKDPRKLCTLLHLCHSNSNRVVLNNFLMMKKVIVNKVFADYCLPCKEYISGLHSVALSKKTKSDFVRAMKKMCQFLPKGVSTVCPAMVNAKGKQIVDSFFDYTSDPSRFCAAVGLCKNRDGHPLIAQGESSKPAAKSETMHVAPLTIACCICRVSTKSLQDFLKNNITTKVVHDYFEDLCSYAPRMFFPQCMAYVDKKEPILYRMLIEKLNPDQVCEDLCREQMVPKITDFRDKKIWTHSVKEKDGPSCELCVFAMGVLQSMLKNNKTAAEIKAKLQQLCKELPEAFQASCTTMVDRYEDEIIRLVIKEMGPQLICQELGLCTSSKKAVAEYLVPRLGIACSMCKYFIQIVYISLADKPTQGRIKDELNKLCKELPTKIADECTAIIRSDYDEFLNIILKELEHPASLCELANCSSATTNAYFPRNGVLCQTCIEGLSYVETLLQSNRTKDIIKVALEQACDMIPSAFRPECKALATKYADIALSFLIDELKNPEKICEEIHLCTSSQVVNVKKSVKAVNSLIECEWCQYAVVSLSIIINNNQAKVEAIMLEICSRLPSSLVKQCSTLIDKYFELLMRIITEKMKNPAEFCKELRMCSSSGKTLLESIHMILPKIGPLCEVCQIGTHYFAAFMKDNATKAIIKKPVLSLCTFVPSSIEEGCTELINKYYEIAYAAFVDNLMKNPLVLCKEIHLCASYEKESTLRMSPISPKAGPLCEVCQMGAQYVATFLKKNGTKAEIKSSILEVCAELPSSIAAECKTLVDEYFDLAYETILEQLEDPLALCQEMHLCTSSVKESTLRMSPISPKAGPLCEVCQMGAQYVETFLKKNGTKTEIYSSILKVCAELPSSIAAECKTMVDEYFDLAYETILEAFEDPLALCQDIRLCTSSVKEILKPAKPNNIVTCEVCELLLQKLDGMLNGSRIKENVKKALDNLCKDLPYSSQCIALVNKYSDEIINLLVEELKNPERVCTELQLCESIFKVKSKNSFTCEICEATTSELKNMLNNSHNRKLVIKALDKVCARLPFHLNTECTNLVDFYAPQLIKYIVDEMKDPENFCKELHLCTDQSKKTVSLSKVGGKSVKNGFVDCELCILGMDYLLAEVKNKISEVQIKKSLNALCDKLPVVKEQCDHLVNKYTHEIIHMILSGVLDSYTICKKLQYCDSTLKAITHKDGQQTKIVEADPAACKLCMFMSGKLDVQLKKSDSKKVIKKTIKSVCSRTKLSKDHKEECRRMMDEYIDVIIKLVKKVELPSLCKKIGHCVSRHAEVNAVMPKFVQALGKPKYGGVSCVVCEYAIGVLDTFLSSQSAKDHIISEVHNLCKKLPRKIFVTECNALITQYGEELIELFVDNVLEPVDICQDLHLC